MKTIARETASRNPVPTGEARRSDNLEHISTIVGRLLASAIVQAARQPEVRCEIVALLREITTATVDAPTGLLTAQQLARALGVSRAHVRRLDPPATIVGDASTRRYDLAAVRAWLAERKPEPTTPKPSSKTADDVDVSDILGGRFGLHAVTGGRRR